MNPWSDIPPGQYNPGGMPGMLMNSNPVQNGPIRSMQGGMPMNRNPVQNGPIQYGQSSMQGGMPGMLMNSNPVQNGPIRSMQGGMPMNSNPVQNGPIQYGQSSMQGGMPGMPNSNPAQNGPIQYGQSSMQRGMQIMPMNCNPAQNGPIQYGQNSMQRGMPGKPMQSYLAQNGPVQFDQSSMQKDYNAFNMECWESYRDRTGNLFQRKQRFDGNMLNMESYESKTDEFGRQMERRMRVNNMPSAVSYGGNLAICNSPGPGISRNISTPNDDSDSDSDYKSHNSRRTVNISTSSDDSDSDSDDAPECIARPGAVISRIQSDPNVLQIAGQGNEVEVSRGFDALLIEGENNVVRVKRSETDTCIYNRCECIFPNFNLSGRCGNCGRNNGRGQMYSADRQERQGPNQMKFGVRGNNNKIFFD